LRSSLRRPVKSAKLVAVRIAQISQIELAERILAIARRILTGGAARFDAALVPRVHLFGCVEVKADRAAVGVASRLAVDRPGDHEDRALVPPCGAALVVGPALFLEQAVVELAAALRVVGADHDVAEHSLAPP